MKRLALLLCLAALIVPSAFAAGVCTSNQDVLVPGFYCTLGPLLFQNFAASLVSPLPDGVVWSPDIFIGAGVPGNLTGYSGFDANLYFQTNFNEHPDMFRDVSFVFQVVGLVTGVDGWLGGTGSRNYVENICVDQACNGPADPITWFLLTPTNRTASIQIAPTQNVWINKDITVSAGSLMSEFSQSFYTVPEPLTLVLVGSGLLGLGLLRRRIRS